MRNYVIINGVNSLTIKGLAINIMPPISKPPMRTLREEIDGRDGDITTELGYGAYDRTMEIGLYGNYDIDEIIAFFNSKGTIVFSDEDNKYYNFEITDKIDYSKLVKFRTASINFHCQPFKYPLNETPLEEEYEYVEGEGTELTLNDTANAIFNKFDVLGNTSQNGTPTPSSPIPINVVSGDNEINICGKNLFTTGNGSSTKIGVNATYNESEVILNGTTTGAGNIFYDETISINTGYRKSQTLSAGTYTLSVKTTGTATYPSGIGIAIYIRDGNGNILKSFSSIANYQTTLTLNSETEIYSQFYVNGSGGVYNNYSIYFQIEKGSTATTYEPYIGNTYPLYLNPNRLQTTKDNFGINSTYGTITETANRYCQYGTIEEGQKYTISRSSVGSSTYYYYAFYSQEPTAGLTPTSSVFGNMGSSTLEFTTPIAPTGAKYLAVFYGAGLSADGRADVGEEKQNTQPIELCKIGTYQDYIYKEDGSWYLHKEIGKVVLNGSENWTRTQVSASNSYAFWSLFTTLGLPAPKYEANSKICNYFPYEFKTWVLSSVNTLAENSATYLSLLFNVDNTIATTIDEWQTWLSTHSVKVYYVLATPTNTLIEDTTLIEQLESLSMANSIQGQTNISQENNDLPFILSVSTLKDGSDHLVINNIGNIYAKPTLDLEGNGIVDIYLNDTQMFEVDLSETNEIVINTQEMEAYNPTTNALANRQVVGDYSKFKLDSGESDLRFSGALTKATITNYQRWL